MMVDLPILYHPVDRTKRTNTEQITIVRCHTCELRWRVPFASYEPLVCPVCDLRRQLATTNAEVNPQ